MQQKAHLKNVFSLPKIITYGCSKVKLYFASQMISDILVLWANECSPLNLLHKSSIIIQMLNTLKIIL